MADSAEQQVLECVERLRQAMLKGDREQLEQLLAPDGTWGHSAGMLETPKQAITSLTSGTFAFPRLDFSNHRVFLYDNTAIVRHVMDADTAHRDEEPGTVRIGVVLGWQKQSDSWKLILRQAHKLC